MTDDPAEQAELLERSGASATEAARYDEAQVFLRSAMDRRRELGDRPGVARLTAALGKALLFGYRIDQARALLEAASAEFADLMPDPGVVALNGQLARAYMLGEDHLRAVEVADRVLAAAEHGDLIEPLADTLITKGTALSSLGRLREGDGVVEIGERLARDRGLTETLMRALNNRGIALEVLDPAGAYACVREGLDLARRLGNRSAGLFHVYGVGWNSFVRCEWDTALEVMEAPLETDLDASNRLSLLARIVPVRALRGESVQHMLDEIETLDATLDDPRLRADLLTARAWTSLAQGRLSAARADQLAAAELIALRPALAAHGGGTGGALGQGRGGSQGRRRRHRGHRSPRSGHRR